MAYILPQVMVFQLFRQLPTTVVKNLNAFVFGPHYQLFRYSVAAEKVLIALGAYDSEADTDYAWPNKPAGSTIDQTYAKLYLDNVWAEYAELAADDTVEARIKSADDLNKIRVGEMVLATANDVSRSTIFKSRDVKVGDRVRYLFTVDATEYAGTTKVVGLEAEVDPEAEAGDPSAKETNQIDVTATDDLDTGNALAITADPDNEEAMGGASTALFALDGNATGFPGSLKDGVVEDVYTIEVTTGGLPGVAKVKVTNASGTYNRTNVPVHGAAYAAGKIYIGNNLYVVLHETGADPEAGDDPSGLGYDNAFVLGDKYTVDVAAGFSALDGSDFTPVGDSTYTGPRNTTYILEVIRGGVFDRVVNVVEGYDLSVGADAAVLSVNPGAAAVADWADWTGGEINDEYILTCTTGGLIGAAEFALTSRTGDNDSVLSFVGDDTEVSFGNRGLKAKFVMDTPGADVFVEGDFWVVRVNACRPQIRVSDSAGVDSSSLITVSDATELDIGNYGVEVNFTANGNEEAGFVPNGGLLKGDVYYVACTAAGEGAVKTMVLADDLPAVIAGEPTTNIAVWLYLIKNGVEVSSLRVQASPDYNWQGTNDAVTVYEGLQVQDAAWYDDDENLLWLDVYSADMYIQYRALLPTYADTIHSLADVADVATTLGTIHPDNPLSQGVYNALLNSGNRAVYYMGVPTNDIAGYSAVLDRAGLSADVYAFVPLTQDSEVYELVEGHINSLSTETEKRWRIAFFGAKTPTSDPIYTALANPGGEEFLAKVSEDPSAAGEYTIIDFTDESGDPTTETEVLSDVKVGDKVRINFAVDAWGVSTYEEYEVEAVVTNTRLRLETGPASPAVLPVKVEVHHPYTMAEMADAIAQQSNGFYNRRIYNVYPDQLGSGDITQSGEFGAAAVAGLCSSVPPQQGLTNIELNGFDDLPLVYQTFNRTQLNKMAEYGTLIIMQDLPGTRVYIRHQVSTAGLSGNLNETELSITKNLDSISYYFAERLAPYIGRYNVTPQTLQIIKTVLQDGLDFLGSLTDVGLLGPQILLAETEIVGVQQHPTLRDHVQALVNLGLPAPMNVIELRLVV